MHNNIMATGSKDRPPMLATGRYAQWRSRFLRYIDTRPNGDALQKCILKEAIHLILTGIEDEIYSTVDACQTAQEMWEAVSPKLNRSLQPAKDTDEEIDEQELEAHYSYMEKIQEVPNADSSTDAEPLEQVQYDTDDNVFANDIPTYLTNPHH
ncbi:hypothetical protein Tco_1508218 [Tanacetum coccineum]